MAALSVALQSSFDSLMGIPVIGRSAMGHSDLGPVLRERHPWNAGQNAGPQRPLKPRDIWAIRFYLDENKRPRDRALFDLEA